MKMGRYLISLGLAVVMIVTLAACTAEDLITEEDRLAMDIQIIDEYLSNNDISAIEDESGLRYVIHEEGDGISPEIVDRVHVRYFGALLGETDPFDSRDSISFPLNGVIEGWQIAFQMLQEGDSATLYIPSGLGYGSTGNGSGSIPPNTNLEFRVKLIQVDKF
jgi:FKBP-type peptidyl-prolyl cis-trans isomerase